MSVTAADLTYPKGELQPTWFPDGDLAANLAIWLAQVDTGDLTDSAAIDLATRAYVYLRAYTAIAGRLAATPTTEKTNDYQTTIGQERIAYFARRAADWTEVYADALASRPTLPPGPRTSTAAAATGAW